ncbi:hypothetical protein DICVIV_09534 [Dictyocaulus viviparus]|uniref:MSP domain-containing protein n=1 Tax=Dictyocaulus viviparus TaxID=29172 RepID=A0A0D8XIG3_DICVI|nr:hypothetical protein DICVIV_09534 [Dictyocaulus viviparus]
MASKEKKALITMEPNDKIRFVGDFNCEIKTYLKITNKSDMKQAFKIPENDKHHFGVYHIPAPEGCTCEGAWSEHYGPPQGEFRLKDFTYCLPAEFCKIICYLVIACGFDRSTLMWNNNRAFMATVHDVEILLTPRLKAEFLDL